MPEAAGALVSQAALRAESQLCPRRVGATARLFLSVELADAHIALAVSAEENSMQYRARVPYQAKEH